jgi:surfactin synthase thioesterase subunit/acyl transferase domain-containing protein
MISLGQRCLARENGGSGNGTWLCSLTGQGDDRRSMLDALGRFYLQGQTIGLQAIEPRNGRRVSLPTYPFQHERFWLGSSGSNKSMTGDVALRSPPRRHPFLGERLGGDDARFEALLSLDRFAFLGDHRVFRRPVLPMVAILDAITAAAESLGFLRPVVADFVYERALILLEDQPVWTQLALEPTAGNVPFRFESTGLGSEDRWQLHASGTLRDDTEPVTLPPFPSHLACNGREVPPARFYRLLDDCGLSYGPAFRGIRELWRDGDQAFAKVALSADFDDDADAIRTIFLDACLHVYAALVREYGQFEGEHSAAPKVYVPIGIDGFTLYRAEAKRAWVHAIVLDRRDNDDPRIKLDIRVYGEDGQPTALFRGLTVRQTSDRTFAPTERPSWQRLLYRLRWQEIQDGELSTPLAKHWWVFCDATGVGERLVEALAAEGCSCALIKPEAPVPKELLTEAPLASIGLVYLRALDAPPTGIGGPGPTAETNALVCGGCLELIQVLERVRDRFPDPPRLWLVTCGAQGGLDCQALIDPVQSPLWGLGRTFALEYPEMWGGLIDLPIGAKPGYAADLLVRELRAGRGEDQVSLRAGKRLAPRLVPFVPSGERRSTGLDTDATYWIVGGLGRLGLRIAETLVTAGARHLVLSGRRPSGDDAARVLESLRRHAEVVVHPADVSREADVESVLARIRQSMPPLRGVIHVAAVFEDAVLANASWGMFERVLRPKISGAWHLHCGTRGLKLDFFVLFSSVLSLWGAAGQGAYVTANSFLDSLAAYRRAQGLPATVFNWGPWYEPGTRERWGNVGAALWKQRGTIALPAETCLDILVSFLGDGPMQVAVTDTRWPDFMVQFSETPALFRELAPAAKRGRANSASSETRSSIEETIGWHAGQVLGLNGRVDVERPLNELGLDSLLAVALGNRLRQALNVAVPTAALLKGPSVSSLVGELFPGLVPTAGDLAQHKASAARIDGNGWLMVHRANPEASMRLFGFPFAGGGAATFRKWTEHLDPGIELVAIEPPGRQTRISEAPIREIGEFLRQLVPELLPFLDKPFAVYGHCLGALTLFETVCTLIGEHGIAPVHVFVSGARAPDQLHRHQEFETDLMERLLKLPGYNLFEPIYQQPDDVFSEAILQFNVLATESLVQDPELRPLILPAIRAEFEMSSNYRYMPGAPWDVPITCLTGIHDTYVSADNARAWSRFTSKQFQLFMRESEHFIVVDDDQFLLRVINHELKSPL